MTIGYTALREAVTELVNKHTQEWKAGHDHLIVEQLMHLYQRHLEEAIKEVIGKNDKRQFEPADNYKVNCRNQLRAEQRERFQKLKASAKADKEEK